MWQPCEVEAMYFPFKLNSKSKTSPVWPFRIANCLRWFFTGAFPRLPFVVFALSFLSPLNACFSSNSLLTVSELSSFLCLLLKPINRITTNTAAAIKEVAMIVPRVATSTPAMFPNDYSTCMGASFSLHAFFFFALFHARKTLHKLDSYSTTLQSNVFLTNTIFRLNEINLCKDSIFLAAEKKTMISVALN